MIRFELRPLGDPVFVTLDVEQRSELAELRYEGDPLGVELAREWLEVQIGAHGVIIGDRASANDVYVALFGPDADKSFSPAIRAGGELFSR